MRVKFNIEDDDSVTNVDSDFDGGEYIKIKRVDGKLVVVVTIPWNQAEIIDGGIYE